MATDIKILGNQFEVTGILSSGLLYNQFDVTPVSTESVLRNQVGVALPDTVNLPQQITVSASNTSYNSNLVGDYCAIDITYERTVATNEIPRAEGVYLYNMGGGLQTITLNGWVVRDTVEETNQYLFDLQTQLGGGPADLVHDGVVYDNSYFQSFSPEVADSRGRTFTVVFKRSAV